jgi:hypothetical protein
VNEPGRIESFVSGHTAPCTVTNQGRTLFLTTSTSFALKDAVKVESGDKLWMGEVWACEPVSDGFHIQIEVHSMLNNAPAVDALAVHFKHARPVPKSIL